MQYRSLPFAFALVLTGCSGEATNDSTSADDNAITSEAELKSVERYKECAVVASPPEAAGGVEGYRLQAAASAQITCITRTEIFSKRLRTCLQRHRDEGGWRNVVCETDSWDAGATIIYGGVAPNVAPGVFRTYAEMRNLDGKVLATVASNRAPIPKK